MVYMRAGYGEQMASSVRPQQSSGRLQSTLHWDVAQSSWGSQLHEWFTKRLPCASGRSSFQASVDGPVESWVK